MTLIVHATSRVASAIGGTLTLTRRHSRDCALRNFAFDESCGAEMLQMRIKAVQRTCCWCTLHPIYTCQMLYPYYLCPTVASISHLPKDASKSHLFDVCVDVTSVQRLCRRFDESCVSFGPQTGAYLVTRHTWGCPCLQKHCLETMTGIGRPAWTWWSWLLELFIYDRLNLMALVLSNVTRNFVISSCAGWRGRKCVCVCR